MGFIAEYAFFHFSKKRGKGKTRGFPISKEQMQRGGGLKVKIVYGGKNGGHVNSPTQNGIEKVCTKVPLQ